MTHLIAFLPFLRFCPVICASVSHFGQIAMQELKKGQRKSGRLEPCLVAVRKCKTLWGLKKGKD
jgi:hypothetical protein